MNNKNGEEEGDGWKGLEVAGVRAGAPSSAACLCRPPLMMSTAGVTCYLQDPRPDSRLSITSRGEGNPSLSLFSCSFSITTTHYRNRKQFGNTAFIFSVGIHFKDNSNLIYEKHVPSTEVPRSGSGEQQVWGAELPQVPEGPNKLERFKKQKKKRENFITSGLCLEGVCVHVCKLAWC